MARAAARPSAAPRRAWSPWSWGNAMSAMSCTRPATASSGSSGCEAGRFAPHCSACDEAVDLGLVVHAGCPRARSASSSSTEAGAVTGPLWRPTLRRGVAPSMSAMRRCRCSVWATSAGCEAPPATATRSVRIWSARAPAIDGPGVVERRRPSASRPRSPCGRSGSRRCSTSTPLLVAPDAWVQLTDTQPSGSPTACTDDDLAEPGLEHVEHVRSDVEHGAPLEAPAVRERAAEERARDEARPPADRFDARGLGHEGGERGIEPVRQHHERADAGFADRVDDRLRAVDIVAQRLFEQQRLARARPRAIGERRVARPGSPRSRRPRTRRTARRGRRTRGPATLAPSSPRVRRRARPDPGHAGLRSGREHRRRSSCGPTDPRRSGLLPRVRSRGRRYPWPHV